MNQKKLIQAKDWDYLIVLDACRYDYFEKIYDNYFEGKLQKATSPGSNTFSWVVETFLDPNFSDTIYISGNPHINSLTPSEPPNFMDSPPVEKFNAKENFLKIIDVWHWREDFEDRISHPQKINEALLEKNKLFPKKRIIAHYIQPHPPLPSPDGNLDETSPKSELGFFSKVLYSFKRRVRSFAGRGLEEVLGEKALKEARKKAGVVPPASPKKFAEAYGVEALRQAYEKNLRFALRYVKNLLEDISGRVVITSDHGERLGEDEKFGHQTTQSDPILREVPWFTTRGRKEKSEGASERNRISEKIEELKQKKDI